MHVLLTNNLHFGSYMQKSIQANTRAFERGI